MEGWRGYKDVGGRGRERIGVGMGGEDRRLEGGTEQAYG